MKMKLIDLLVQELPARGGWPCSTKDVWALKPILREYRLEFNATPGSQWFSDPSFQSVSKEQYEAALAASKQVEWQPGALPPEGIECEVKSGKESWTLCKVVHSSSAGVAFIYLEEQDACVSYLGVLDSISAKAAADQFRPIRTEAERKREGAIDYINMNLDDMNEVLASNIYDLIASGKVPGIKLSD